MTRLLSKRAALAVLALGLAVAALLPIGSPAGGQAQPEAGSSDWRMVSTGNLFACGIRTTGLLYCWGADDHAQLGTGAGTDAQPVPVLGGGGYNDWQSVSAGHDFACGLRSGRAAYCWGDNSDGQLGNGTTDPFDLPTAVQGANNYWLEITAGVSHACGRFEDPTFHDRRLACWGSNDSGQLGRANPVDQLQPRPVGGGFHDWTTVDAGQNHTCARRANGRLYCWGDNTFGQLGDGTTTDRTAPRLVAGGITDWRSIAVAGMHTCALRANGRMYCWGDNAHGQLGDGTTNDRLSPHLVPGGGTWTAVATGGFDGLTADLGTTCGRRSTGRLYCWGRNAFGMVGDGTEANDRLVPTAVAGGATDWRAVSLSSSSTCATTTGSRAYCWGFNPYGGLGAGPGDFSRRSRPQEIWAGGSPGSSGGSSGTSSGSSGTTSSSGSSGTSSGGSSGTSSGSSGTTSSSGSSGTSSGGSSGTSTGGSSGTDSASSMPSGSNGMTSSALFLAVGAVLAAAGAVLIDGRRWQPLDGLRDTAT